MELTLSENIRSLRKQRHLTQEQLAEVLGVTAGAVYKWESGLSVPELDLIVEMADFFDISVDTLLGYRMKDNREEAVLDRLKGFFSSHDPQALTEAEKALKKYPHSFKVVYISAKVYTIIGSSTKDRAKLHRALDLLETSRGLLRQNRDPEISETRILGDIAGIYCFLGEYEKGMEILKKNNTGGIFNETIGSNLAIFMGRPEEAEPYLTEALLQNAFGLFGTAISYAFVYLERKEFTAARDMLTMSLNLLQGIRKETEAPDFLDELQAVLLVLLACTELAEGRRKEAAAAIRKAAEAAARFDAMPDYSIKGIRFGNIPQEANGYFGYGRTAAESIAFLLGVLKDEELAALWKEVCEDEQ